MNPKTHCFIIFISLASLMFFSGCIKPVDSLLKDPVVEKAEPYISKIVRNNTELRNYANSIIGNCSSREGQVNAIYRHIVENYEYISDPEGVELIQTPQQTIQRGGGDCEDLSILLNSLLENIGIKTFLVLTKTHCYSLAYNVNPVKLWPFVERSLIDQVEKDWGDNVHQTYKQTFLLKGKHSWYYGGNGSKIEEYFDYLNISYNIKSDKPLNIYVVPSQDDFENLSKGKKFYQYTECQHENVFAMNDTCSFLHRHGGLILSNEKWDDATVTVDIRFYFRPSFYKLFGKEKITAYKINNVNCVVLDPTAGKYGFPGYDAGLTGKKTAIDPVTKEYLYLQ